MKVFNCKFDPTTAFGRMRMMRAGGNVRRYHTTRMIKEQTVAAHSWGVAMVVLQIYPNASAALLRAALTHDSSEAWTGDLPAHVKWTYPKYKEAEDAVSNWFNDTMGIEEKLTPLEYQLLKWADYFELALYCYEEVNMGNGYAAFPIDCVMPFLKEKAPNERAKDLINELNGMDSRAGGWYA